MTDYLAGMDRANVLRASAEPSASVAPMTALEQYRCQPEKQTYCLHMDTAHMLLAAWLKAWDAGSDNENLYARTRDLLAGRASQPPSPAIPLTDDYLKGLARSFDSTGAAGAIHHYRFRERDLLGLLRNVAATVEGWAREQASEPPDAVPPEGTVPAYDACTDIYRALSQQGLAYKESKAIRFAWEVGRQIVEARAAVTKSASECGACDKPGEHCANVHGICSRHGGRAHETSAALPLDDPSYVIDPSELR